MQINLAQPDLAALAATGDLAQNAEPTKGFPAGLAGGWIAEPKFDGWRILAVVRDDRVDFHSRSGKTYNGKLPKVEAELLANFPAGTVLDGEAVALRVVGGKVLNEWGTTQSIMTTLGGAKAADKVSFMVFDLLAHRGIDARPLAYAQRRSLLEAIFADADFEAVTLTAQVAPTEAAYDALVEQGFEGMILKRLDARYVSGKRGAGWKKVKATATVEVVVTGFKPGKDGFAGMVGAVEFGQYDDAGNLIPRGRCSGMDMRTRLEMTNHPEKWLGTVIEIAHMGVSIGAGDSGKFRHPQFKRRRPDKAAAQVLIHDA